MPPKPKPLDLELIEKLASIHCTMEEMASVCSVSVDTLERRCADLIKKAKDKGRSSLRRLQWSKAQEGNVTMMIWLGKQLLAQRDKVDQMVTQTNNDDEKLAKELAELRDMIQSYKICQPTSPSTQSNSESVPLPH